MANKKKGRTKTVSPRRRPRAVAKHPSGIRGFDTTLEGGLPRGRVLLVVGGPGTGKTVWLNEFVYRGATLFGERAVYVTFEEAPDDIALNVGGFGWDYDRLIAEGSLLFVDASPALGAVIEVDHGYDMTPLLARIRRAVAELGARRLAIDGLDGLFERLGHKAAVRDMLFALCHEVRRTGVTTMMSSEARGGADGLLRRGVAEFVADAVIELTLEAGQENLLRRVSVRKLRGSGYRTGAVEFDIGAGGIEVFPKVPVDRSFVAAGRGPRRTFGIRAFDEALGGGLPQGSLILIAGNTGTGKTTFAGHFAMEGLRAGEPVIYVALEEPSGQLREVFGAYGWRVRRFERTGSLEIIDVPLIDIRSDQVLYRVLRSVEQRGARRVVVDSISSLRSATMSAEKVRQFVVQLSEFIKSRGITCVMCTLIPGGAGGSSESLLPAARSIEMRLSSVVDGVILLRHLESGGAVRKTLGVLKLRGSSHASGVLDYELTSRGVRMRAGAGRPAPGKTRGEASAS